MIIYAFMTYRYYVYYMFDEIFLMSLASLEQFLALAFIVHTFYYLRLNYGGFWVCFKQWSIG